MEKIWLNQYPPEVEKNINPDEYHSINDLFDKNSKNFSDRPAFSNLGVSITYKELKQLSTQFAAFLLKKLELKKNDRVAIMMPNLLQYPVAVYGVLRAGLTVVNVNPLYTARELKQELNDAKASAIIVLSNFAKTLQEVVSQTSVKHVIVTEVGDLLGLIKGAIVNFVVKKIKRMVPEWKIPNAISFKEVLEASKNLSFEPQGVGPDDIAFLQYTGGTTGVPKGAELTHRNMVANVLQSIACFKPLLEPGHEVVLGALPLYHIFALTVCCLCFMLVGAECVLITNPRDLKIFLKILKKQPPTIFVGVNTLFNGLLNQPAFHQLDFSSLKLTVGGGMAIQKNVADRWKRLTGNHITEGYGLTEASPVVLVNPVNLTDYSGSAGLPIPSTDIAIRDEKGKELPIGEVGELCVKGPQVMPGYWNNPDETAKVLDEEGWLKTGDMAKVDEKGFTYIVDRKKDMIVVSGFNVFPNEIEDVIMTHDGVKEVAVIGVPNHKSGELVKAFIVKEDPDLTKEQITDFCRKNLTAYKVPKEIEFRDDLPKTNVGKVLRRHLRDKES